jgi:hypothetical protein
MATGFSGGRIQSTQREPPTIGYFNIVIYVNRKNKTEIDDIVVFIISISHNKFLYIILLLLAHSIYLARQHYRRTIPSGEDDNRIIYRKLLCQMELRNAAYHGKQFKMSIQNDTL